MIKTTGELICVRGAKYHSINDVWKTVDTSVLDRDDPWGPCRPLGTFFQRCFEGFVVVRDQNSDCEDAKDVEEEDAPECP